VDDIVRSGAADLGRYRDGPQPSVHALADIRRTAAHLLAEEKRTTINTTVGLDRLGVSYDSSHACIRPVRGAAYRAEQWALTPRSSIAAIGITAAVLAMTKPLTAAAEISTARYRAPRPTAETAALGNMMRPSDELRYRTGRAALSTCDAETGRVATLARRTPTMLWPAWSLRFALPHCQQSQLGPALSILLLLVDTRLPLADAAALLSSPLNRASCSRILQLLSNRADWPETRTALGRIADYLTNHDTPIEYQRRRHLNYEALLPDQTWATICRHTTTLSSRPSRARIVRYHLYQRLSGRPINDFHPAAIQAETITQVNNFPLHLTPDLARALEEHCRDFLCQNGISDEPPFWSPPATVLSGLQLPGPNPDNVDTATMQRLLGDSCWSGSRIAKQLSTTLPVVRHLCERNATQPSPGAEPAGSRRTSSARALQKARTALAPEYLAKLYCQDLHTLNEIAAEVGVSRGTIAQLAREYEIELRPGGTLPRLVVDRDWLYEEYVVKRRTLPDIAAELGMSPTNMARWARSHHIPMRPRGGNSHRAHLADQLAAESAPRLLRPTLAGVGGWQRLERFAIATQFPTMTAAAQHLRAPGLVLQLERLEAELGFKLFARAERGRPMQLTDNGQRVLAAVRRAQRSRSRLSTPDTPPTGSRPQPEG
jgi:AraC-like DNA-binding protein